jgi:hypothetical protein
MLGAKDDSHSCEQHRGFRTLLLNSVRTKHACSRQNLVPFVMKGHKRLLRWRRITRHKPVEFRVDGGEDRVDPQEIPVVVLRSWINTDISRPGRSRGRSK